MFANKLWKLQSSEINTPPMNVTTIYMYIYGLYKYWDVRILGRKFNFKDKPIIKVANIKKSTYKGGPFVVMEDDNLELLSELHS